MPRQVRAEIEEAGLFHAGNMIDWCVSAMPKIHLVHKSVHVRTLFSCTQNQDTQVHKAFIVQEHQASMNLVHCLLSHLHNEQY